LLRPGVASEPLCTSLLAQVGLYEVAKRFRVQDAAAPAEKDMSVGEKAESVVVDLEQA
jgi:hypothetical protein